MRGPDWLTARPVAHRGLHDAAAGRIENTLPAVAAAIEHGFAVEVDLQLSGDGEAMVFHDFTLDRLTTGAGEVAGRKATELAALPLRAGAARMPTLADLLDLTAGRTPLFIELKSRFDGAVPLVARTAALLARYDGPVAVMSFDPEAVRAFKSVAPKRPVGIVAEVFGDYVEWQLLSRLRKHQLSNLADAFAIDPTFIAYNVRHLPSIACETVCAQRGIPLLTWTVRTPEQRATAERYARQMIFEGFVP
jgi:glycerophosphoryl diester phosphodiesterase